MPRPHAAWTDEMQVRFDADELSAFFDQFAPLQIIDLDGAVAAPPGQRCAPPWDEAGSLEHAAVEVVEVVHRRA